ncbi:MAG: hypothetical protein A3G02_01885 [Candidatus Yanofskybacteria bacterium RIFCSPLOWO2_12_FULL_44_13b]|uniref:Uncharacterized protein n=2 Tax=Candidatus Yanofskyibacteriota TaxID=1752733 RepID=A0A1F8H2T7_9BACT|nr:MAG: hypothetical protein UW14_C0016G0007 [Candidatus Yanofskybacteria bacterium GW2011_GWA2_44_10]KKT90361.1 MAG: hypothetical protein UW90_C0002G0010 [Candidatus Yanofskybacteria bacterium GW2011_GWB1_45_11]OGN14913.1 MAG: hypothetical protein A3C01_02295 [Candidatus Yanofskybacteria bacterium RIFCSPHIGHO2_02_FULL_44_36b]OGN31256.1 MAG: hypothetical protein A3I96_00370 [Candidatus Yanofskybacteria bacterium RIFCSPLOWO2_02_FULL_44_18]OGN35356.1 MAG: hypothetical protein A3G02_01885 [Candida
MRKYLFLFLFVTLSVYPFKTDAVSSICTDPKVYDLQLQISAPEGKADSPVTLEGKFKWLDNADNFCLTYSLRFDFGYITKSGGYDTLPKGEISFGQAGRDKYVSKTITVKPSDLFFSSILTDGYTITFKLKVENDAAVGGDLNTPTFPQTIKRYTINSKGTSGGLTSLVWACVAKDGVYACSPGNKSDLSDTPACKGLEKSAIRVENQNCGKPASSVTQSGVSGKYEFSVPNFIKGGPETILDLIKVILDWLIKIAIPIAVIMIIYGGLLFLYAGQKPELAKKGRAIVTYAVLGLAIIFIGGGFITLIQSALEAAGGAGNQINSNGSNANQEPIDGLQ